MNDFEITVIGAGVVGLAIASQLSQRSSRVLVVEKNSHYGMETSSRNSEVIHAGIYYTPDSLKAKLCVEGNIALYKLCRKHSLTHKRITKLITATSHEELPALETLRINAMQNDVALQFLNANEVQKLEPHIQSCGALFSPTTGIISAHELMSYFFHNAKNNTATMQFQCAVTGIEHYSGGYKILLNENGAHTFITSEKVINAAGLYSDTIAAMAGINIDEEQYRMNFSKGNYFAITSAKRNLISRLVYPAPSNESLGVHAVIDVGGRLKFGPDIEYIDGREFNYTVDKKRKSSFYTAIKKILPHISEDDISAEMCGIRPKLQRRGEPQRDFIIAHEKAKGLDGFVNLIGIESPGLTASPAIAHYVEKILYR
ncbi:MAG: NAD(P)/FAD-dependent oxidoreductase [Bacteroidota bacterium]